jgi:hypothetical protein
LLVGYVSIHICAPNASPARTALPTAHFDRNERHAISGTGHYPLTLEDWKSPQTDWQTRLSLDSEVEGIVLVLDSWDFGAEKRARSFGNHFVPSL